MYNIHSTYSGVVTKCRITKRRTHKMSNHIMLNHKMSKNKMSNSQNVELTKCRIHIMSNAQNVEFTKCRISQEKSANFVFKNFAKLEEKIRKISRFKTLKNTCSCCAMMFSLFVSNISM